MLTQPVLTSLAPQGQSVGQSIKNPRQIMQPSLVLSQQTDTVQFGSRAALQAVEEKLQSLETAVAELGEIKAKDLKKFVSRVSDDQAVVQLGGEAYVFKVIRKTMSLGGVEGSHSSVSHDDSWTLTSKATVKEPRTGFWRWLFPTENRPETDMMYHESLYTIPMNTQQHQRSARITVRNNDAGALQTAMQELSATTEEAKLARVATLMKQLQEIAL